MRPHKFVRLARPEEAPQFLEWSQATPDNNFDPLVPGYHATFTLCAYDRTGPLVYMPVQMPLFMEGIAVRPGLDKSDVAACLKEFTQACVTEAHTRGVGEIYFLGSEAGTDAMAQNHVFEELPYKVYRLKIKDTER